MDKPYLPRVQRACVGISKKEKRRRVVMIGSWGICGKGSVKERRTSGKDIIQAPQLDTYTQARA